MRVATAQEVEWYGRSDGFAEEEYDRGSAFDEVEGAEKVCVGDVGEQSEA